MERKPQLNTCLSPSLIPLFNLKDTITVVIDIFRATSTICAAIDNGANAVIPVATVRECFRLEREEPDVITAGERNGRVIKGLQGGNSPLEYTPDFIRGKTLALTTTNGTRLLHMVKDADEVVIGSFLNLDALCNYLISRNKNVLLACAGWRNRVNLEDTLFAGTVINKIGHYFKIDEDSSILANSIYQKSQEMPHIIDFLKSGSHYHRLASFYLEEDINYCCQINLHPVVPVFKNPYLVSEQKDIKEKVKS